MELSDLFFTALLAALLANAVLLWKWMSQPNTSTTNSKTNELNVKVQRLSAIQSTLIELTQFETPSLDLQIQKYLIVSATNLNANRVGLWQLNADRDQLYCICMLDNGEFVQESWTIRVEGKTDYFDSMRRGQIAELSDTSAVTIESDYHPDYLAPRDIKALLDVPVTINGELIAIVTHEDTQNPRQWTDVEKEQATNIADLCAIAFVSEENREAAAKLETTERLLNEARTIAKLDSFVWRVASDELLLSNSFTQSVIGNTPILSIADLSELIATSDRQLFLTSMAELSKSNSDRDSRHFKSVIRIHPPHQPLLEEPVYFEITAEASSNHSGEVRGTIQDITDRVLAEQTNQKLQDRLLEAQKLETIGTLARGVAHDFNNLLTPVIGYAEILSSQFEDDNPSKQYSDQINRSGLRAKTLVEQLLTFSREQDTNHQPIDLVELCERSTRAIEPLLRSSITFTNRCAQLIQIQGDPNQLHQVLLNLCLNADSATEGEGKISIILEVAVFAPDVEVQINAKSGVNQAQTKHYALIKVVDNGPGIEEEVRQHMFEPFYTTHEVGEGPGLGLSVVHGIMTRHHGMIEVESKQQGTEFKLLLPLLAPPSPLDAPPLKIKM